jgi:hypothetical protein
MEQDILGDVILSNRSSCFALGDDDTLNGAFDVSFCNFEDQQ